MSKATLTVNAHETGMTRSKAECSEKYAPNHFFFFKFILPGARKLRKMRLSRETSAKGTMM